MSPKELKRGECPSCNRYVGEFFIWRGRCPACRALEKANKRGGAVSVLVTNKLDRMLDKANEKKRELEEKEK